MLSPAPLSGKRTCLCAGHPMKQEQAARVSSWLSMSFLASMHARACAPVAVECEAEGGSACLALHLGRPLLSLSPRPSRRLSPALPAPARSVAAPPAGLPQSFTPDVYECVSRDALRVHSACSLHRGVASLPRPACFSRSSGVPFAVTRKRCCLNPYGMGHLTKSVFLFYSVIWENATFPHATFPHAGGREAAGVSWRRS